MVSCPLLFCQQILPPHLCALSSTVLYDLAANIVVVLRNIERMNKHIYSTLFKTQERKSERRSKKVEHRK